MRAWIEGRSVDQHEAVTAIGRALYRARAPIIGGLAGDVDAIRAAYRLARSAGASLDCEGSAGLYDDLGVLASRGAMTTTWAEASARADLILVVGEKAARAPLLLEILGRSPSRAGASERRVVSVGAWAGGDESGSHRHSLIVEPARLPAALGLLRAVAAGRMPLAGDAAGLAGLAEAVAQAKFGVAVYDPGELGELAIDMLQGLVKDLNEKARFSTLPLGVADAARAVLAVGAWMTGDPPRVGLARGYPEHDPWRFDAIRLMTSGEADAALWIDASKTMGAWPVPGMATAALLGEAHGREAGIVVEVAVPGRDRAGSIFEPRRGTFVHVEASAASARPAASAIIDAIRAVIEQEGGRSC